MSRLRECDHPAGPAGERGQMLILLMGLITLILMVLALGWDASNWVIGQRALNNLADGAAIAAANDVDTDVYYESEGTEVRVALDQATATVNSYLGGSSGDTGVEGVRLAAPVQFSVASGTPQVTVTLTAPTPVAFLRFLPVGVPPEMDATATATPQLIGP
ncbi:MAG: pilus assembly protein TadG-related protein [Sporichthyaceae bacterium]|nr:pilus assembly protein TadG-related protein [Sporichthyaceae bacterium]